MGAKASEVNTPPPGVPAVANYVYVSSTGLWSPQSGVDGGAGSTGLVAIDEYATQYDTADQPGSASVLTFTLGAPCSLVIVTSIGAVSRANVSGGTPSAATGLVCVDGGPTYIPVRSVTTVKVYAPGSTVVSVSGLARG